MSNQEQRLLRALRRRFAGPSQIMRRLGLDEALLNGDPAPQGDPSDDDPADRIIELFRTLGPDERQELLNALAQEMNNEAGETAGDAERRRYARDKSQFSASPQPRQAHDSAAAQSFNQRFPGAARIRHDFL